jgi:GntR family transcriptional regulator / MocR family aminotransferase
MYLIAREAGRLTVGDPVAPPRSGAIETIARPLAPAVATGRQLFMCGGCYFIYEQALGLPEQSIAPGTPFAAIPSNWRCPDCGTEKTTFRPHVEATQHNATR